ncbi:hypothetical protein N7516_001866 [Penicillium verrucosum]|uniref:uncharacterized protein n=1 Tax=Penicillium verrucosum TaxID=60171 RepID=UPI0025451F6B|nr:uncharacterized protein N7516_001866 [Penicillium verrucosum]KAJ5941698.1 hypothetical protein N7516_001866 [Penicillium verrucosum]
MLIIVFIVNYASVIDLLSDTNIYTDQFSNLTLAFYMIYLFFELPTGFLIQRLPTAKYLGFNSLMVLRVMLRCFESTIAPTYVYSLRTLLRPPLISFQIDPNHIDVQIIFLVFGLITITVGISIFFFLPDNPITSRLTYAEKILAIERLRENQIGIENKHFKRNQFVETYLIVIIVTAINVPNTAISSFTSLIIKNFSFTTKETELLNIPNRAVSIVSILTISYFAGRYNQRCLYVVISLVYSLLGGYLLTFSPKDIKGAQLIGNYLTQVTRSALLIIYSLASANIAGHTKKVSINAILLISFCLGNILSPLTFRTKDKPDYIPTKIAIVVTISVAIIFTIRLRIYCILENRRKDKNREGEIHQENFEFLDITDRENCEFRGSLKVIYLD